MVFCDPVSLELLPRVCAFGVPGQSKTHGNSRFEIGVEDLETDLLAAHVANECARCVLYT